MLYMHIECLITCVLTCLCPHVNEGLFDVSTYIHITVCDPVCVELSVSTRYRASMLTSLHVSRVCHRVCVDFSVCCSVITVPASAGICFLNAERLLSHHWCSVCYSVLRCVDTIYIHEAWPQVHTLASVLKSRTLAKVWTYIYIRVYIYPYIYIYTYIYMYIYMWIYVYRYTFKYNVCTYIYMCTLYIYMRRDLKSTP